MVLGVTWNPCCSSPGQEARAPRALLGQRQVTTAKLLLPLPLLLLLSPPPLTGLGIIMILRQVVPVSVPTPLAASISESALQSGPYHPAAGPARGCPSL